MTSKWIAWRIVREISRDHRTIAFLFVVPIVVMTLIYFAVAEDELVKVGVETRGVARLFDADMINAIESEDDVEIVQLGIPDEETDNQIIVNDINKALKAHQADVVLYMDEKLLQDRFDGKQGTLHVYIEGTHPTVTATALGAIGDAMDDLAAAMPTVIDSSCSALCANSVNSLPMHIEEHYLYGSEDYRMVDYFLPAFPPFFVFFFTFILSAVSFQRERVNGTLDRLLISPVSFLQIVTGYVGGFFIFAFIQAAIILAYVLVLVSFTFTISQVISISFVVILMTLIGLLLGLLASFVAHNEFQALQFIPLVILPQVFLSDMIWNIESFPPFFQWLSYPLPLTHANGVMRDVMLKNLPLWQSWPELLALLGFIVVILTALVKVGKSNA